MRNELLDYLMRLLEGNEICIVTPNGYKLLPNKELAAIVRNATKNINTKLDTIHTTFQQHCHQH